MPTVTHIAQLLEPSRLESIGFINNDEFGHRRPRVLRRSVQPKPNAFFVLLSRLHVASSGAVGGNCQVLTASHPAPSL
jgi:hypothetical protein